MAPNGFKRPSALHGQPQLWKLWKLGQDGGPRRAFTAQTTYALINTLSDSPTIGAQKLLDLLASLVVAVSTDDNPVTLTVD